MDYSELDPVVFFATAEAAKTKHLEAKEATRISRAEATRTKHIEAKRHAKIARVERRIQSRADALSAALTAIPDWALRRRAMARTAKANRRTRLTISTKSCYDLRMAKTKTKGAVIAQIELKREPGYLYFIDGKGNVGRRQRNPGHHSSISVSFPNELVSSTGIKKRPGYWYYIKGSSPAQIVEFKPPAPGSRRLRKTKTRSK